MLDLPRDNDGQLSAWAFPGGYPLYYLDGMNSVLCVTCARKSDADVDEPQELKPIAVGVNYEDPALYCDDCSERIKSAYAED